MKEDDGPKSPCNCTPVCARTGHHVGLGRMNPRDRARSCGKILAFGYGPRCYCTKRCRAAGRHVAAKHRSHELLRVMRKAGPAATRRAFERYLNETT